MASLGERELRRKPICFSVHEYDYRKKGAEAAATTLGMDLSSTVKTLVVGLSDGRHVFILAPGHVSVSMRSLARCLGAKTAEMASERNAERLTGYRVGGIGPFGSRTKMAVYADLGILDHDVVYINGGRRGLLLGLEPEKLLEAAEAELIDVSL